MTRACCFDPAVCRQVRREWGSCRCTDDRKALAARVGLTLPELHLIARSWGLR